MKIQLCCAVSLDEIYNRKTINKLQELKEVLDNEYEDDYTIVSCHMPREVLKEKGLSTSIIDALYLIYGDKYVNHCEATTYSEALVYMNKFRSEVASSVDSIIVISEHQYFTSALEIATFTNNKVKFF